MPATASPRNSTAVPFRTCRSSSNPSREKQFDDYIDAWLSPEAGAHLIDEIGYGHSNRRSFERVDPARLAELGMESPLESLGQGVVYQPVEPSLRETYNRIFEEVQAGL